MYTHYYYLFIVAGWILTSAMIYGIILSLNYNKV
jgi:NADH:ubiquinone oxidoreductase subunit 6 (subunit J)